MAYCDLDELFISGLSCVSFLFIAPTVGGNIAADFLEAVFSFVVITGGASAISTSDVDPELDDESSSELFDESLSSPLDLADREGGFRNLTGACIVSSPSELEPISPVSPSPKPEGLNRIFRPLGCCRTGFLAATVAREAAFFRLLMFGSLTTC